MSIQLETFNATLNSLTGLTKTAAKKILNRDFIESLNKIMNGNGAENTNDGIKKLIEIASLKVTNGIRQKIAVIFTIIFILFAIIATVITLAAGGNIIIPLVIFAVIIAIIWVITGKISKSIARKVSDKIFKAIESKIPR